MPAAWPPVSGSPSEHWSSHSPLRPHPSGAQGTGRQSSNLRPKWSPSWSQCYNLPQANPGEPGQRETHRSTAGWGGTARGVGAQGAPPTQGISPLTYPWAKQGQRPACDFWSATGQALKKRTTSVFILTEAIYSISAILFVPSLLQSFL